MTLVEQQRRQSAPDITPSSGNKNLLLCHEWPPHGEKKFLFAGGQVVKVFFPQAEIQFEFRGDHLYGFKNTRLTSVRGDNEQGRPHFRRGKIKS
jgi:hypothetical protein